MVVRMTTRTDNATTDQVAHTNSARSAATRERILEVAEQLFAEYGLFAVSNRQVSEAAGQGNNAAVGYHFGTKTDLLRAIVDKHAIPIERRRRELLAAAEGSTEIRDWITCFVRASTDHYCELNGTTWYARFSVQLLSDPSLREIVYEDVASSPVLQIMLRALAHCLPPMPDDVRHARSQMARYTMVHMCAERERQLASGDIEGVPSWEDFSTDLVDALVGLWCAPVSRSTTRS